MTDAKQNTSAQTGSRPASPFRRSSANTDNQSKKPQNNANNSSASRPSTPPPPRRFSPFGNRQAIEWDMVPLHKTLVRVDLKGLGDPFYKLLGHPLNDQLSDSQSISQALQKGGESVEALKEYLENSWKNYDLTGAILVYRWVPDNWKGLQKPSPMPSNLDKLLQDLGDDDDEFTDDDETPLPDFTCLRALDLPLVLNILSRARTQVLLTESPIILDPQYLGRTLILDDPRIAAIVRATGYLEESLAS